MYAGAVAHRLGGTVHRHAGYASHETPWFLSLCIGPTWGVGCLSQSIVRAFTLSQMSQSGKCPLLGGKGVMDWRGAGRPPLILREPQHERPHIRGGERLWERVW